MRIVFGVLGLLVVLAIVGSLAKTQLQAVNGGVATRARAVATEATGDPTSGSRDGATVAIPGGMPGATAADTSALTVPQQSRNLQEQVRNDAVRAMQQGMDRNARADP
jgi:hypothetical protein